MRKSICILAGVLLMAASCSQTEKTEETTAEIEAAQMEGRNAAKAFVNKEWADTMQLQQLLLEARSKKSKYDIEKKSHCSAAYDSAFVSTLRTVRPDVARHL